jgi:hypothetical protein
MNIISSKVRDSFSREMQRTASACAFASTSTSRSLSRLQRKDGQLGRVRSELAIDY